MDFGEKYVGIVSFVSKTEFSKDEWNLMGSRIMHFLDVYEKKHSRDPLKELKIYVKDYHPDGQRKEYEMEALFLTEKERLHSKKNGWDPAEVVEKLMDSLKKQLDHRHEH